MSIGDLFNEMVTTMVRYRSSPDDESLHASLIEVYQQHVELANQTNVVGQNLLMRAAVNKDPGLRKTCLKLMQFLLDQGADPYAVCDSGWTALHYAIHSLDPRRPELLLKKMNDIGHVTKQGNTVLHFAVTFGGHPLILEQILGRVEIDAVDDEGNTALHDAVYQNALESVKLLVRHGADISIQNKQGRAVLQVAQDNEQDEIVSYLQAVTVALKEKKVLSHIFENQDQNHTAAVLKPKEQVRKRL